MTADLQSPLSILVAANVAADPNAGASGTVWQMNAALRRRGHSVREIWSDSLRRRIRHGNLHYLVELPRTYRRAVREACRSERFDVIELNQPHACLAAIEHRKSGRPGIFVNRSHGHETRSEEDLQHWRQQMGIPRNQGLRGIASRLIQSLLDRQWKSIVQTADGFVVSCTQDAEFLKARYHVASERVGCITQGVPQVFLDQRVAPMTQERIHRLLYVGQLAFFKAPHVLAKAVSLILSAHPGAAMTWICGTAHHGEAMELLDASVRDRVTLVNWMDQTQLRSLLDTHGVFLFPSYFEGFGKAPLEAMSRGMCVVATNVGGMRDYIQEGVSGLLVPPGQPDQVAAAARRFLASPALASSVSAAARRTAEQHTWDRCAADAELFYRSLIQRKQQSSR